MSASKLYELADNSSLNKTLLMKTHLLLDTENGSLLLEPILLKKRR